MKDREVRPYWVFLKPLFKRYDIVLSGPPTELLMQDLVRKWLVAHDIELLAKRNGLGIDVVDFEFYFEGILVGIEVKGYCGSGSHDTRRILKQLKRYLKHDEFVVLLVHSMGLEDPMRRLLIYSDEETQRRILVMKVRELELLRERISEKIGTI